MASWPPFAWGTPPPPKKLEVVIVQLKTQLALRGALAEHRRDALVLKAAAQSNVDPSGHITWTSLAGEIVIPMDNIDFWQAGIDPAIMAE